MNYKPITVIERNSPKHSKQANFYDEQPHDSLIKMDLEKYSIMQGYKDITTGRIDLSKMQH